MKSVIIESDAAKLEFVTGHDQLFFPKIHHTFLSLLSWYYVF